MKAGFSGSPGIADLSVMPLTMSVIRLVQSAMLPYPRQEQLAELLLGGIIKIKHNSPASDQHETDKMEYEFQEGVREILERKIFRTELDRVFQCVSNFIEHRIGTPFDFIALLAKPEGEEQIPEAVQPFATIARAALQRLGIRPTVSLDVISLVASSCGYYGGQIEPRAAQ